MNKRTQLFIDSIHHWIVDGLEMFEDGLKFTTNDLYYWSDGSEFKLNAEYCPLCIKFGSNCAFCYLDGAHHYCFKPYIEFRNNPCLQTCEAVIEGLFNTWKDGWKYE